MMTRKLIATGIAVIVSIPLIPVLERGIEHLTGTDVPTVVAGQGWKLAEKTAQPRGNASITNYAYGGPVYWLASGELTLGSTTSAPDGKYNFTYDSVGNRLASIQKPSSLTTYAYDGLGRRLSLRGSVNTSAHYSPLAILIHQPFAWGSAYDISSAAVGQDGRFYIYSDADSAGNHFAATGNFGGFYIGYVGGEPVWAGVNWQEPKYYAPDTVNRSSAFIYGSAAHLGKDLQIFVGGANQRTSWRPSIASIAPTETSAEQAFTLTVSGSGFASDAEIAWNWADGRPSTDLTLGSGSEAVNSEFQLSANVNYLAQSSGAQSARPTSIVKLPDPAAWEVAARACTQLAQEWPQHSSHIDSERLDELIQTATALEKALKNIEEIPKHNTVEAKPHRVAKTGWYALEVGQNSAHHVMVDVEFMPDNRAKPEVYTLKDSGSGGHQAAWIHFKEPGSLIVRARGSEEASIRGMDWPEFVARWRDSTWQRGFLTVTLLNDVLPLMAYILVVCVIRFVAYWLIGKLPRAVRTRATQEVDLMIAFAKWSGVGCYTLWTVKDILAGVAIVLAK